MSFNAIFANIYTLLANDAALIPGLLGPRTVQNQRLYRVFPQVQNLLEGYEPNQPAQGWCVIEESEPSLRMAQRQAQTNHEFADIRFHVFGTTFSLTHDVLDVLDGYFHWSIEQMRDVQWGNRFLLFTRRMMEIDTYVQENKIYEKQILYAMEFVREEDAA